MLVIHAGEEDTSLEHALQSVEPLGEAHTEERPLLT